VKGTALTGRGLVSAGSRLFFLALDEHGWEPWTSDGTADGTHLLLDVNPGSLGSGDEWRNLVPVGDGLAVFAGSDGVSGVELWFTDGTTSGTRMLQDVWPGPRGSDPAAFFVANGNLFFSANDGVHGREPWVLPLSAVDAHPPSLACPPPLVVEATGPDGAAATFAATASDDISPEGAITLTYEPESGTTFSLGTTAVRVAARDAFGNVASCTFDVTVADSTAPSLTCPARLEIEAQGLDGARVSFEQLVATDAVTLAPTVAFEPASGSLLPLGVTSIAVTATDDAANAASCAFEVVVVDTSPPVLACPSAVVAEATAPTGAVVTYPAATASDPVGVATVAYSAPSGTTFAVGNTVVTVTASDATGNSAACTFGVSVRDTAAPAVVCPSDLVVEATGRDGAVVTYPPAVATDSVTLAPAMDCTNASGSTFPLGTTAVTINATDDAGNAAACTFSVEVLDSTPPSIVCPADVSAETDDPSGTALDVEVATATDAVSAEPAVVSSRAIDLAFPVGTTAVTFTATDAAGNAASCTMNVTVALTDPPQDASGCGCGTGSAGLEATFLVAALAVWRGRRGRARLPDAASRG
jgi:ELWxxDGT repeat protein